MRIFLSFILSLTFFIAPLEQKAGALHQPKIDQAIGSLKQTDLSEKLLIDDCDALITASANQSAASARVKYFPVADRINAAEISYANFRTSQPAYYIHPHFYCKPIGLKLLFPKHYFW